MKKDVMLELCKQQGYVPAKCTLSGAIVFGLINKGENPCDGCNEDRNKCDGRVKKILNCEVNMNNYFGIGIENIKTHYNLGTLFRSALIFNSNFIFTVNKRYKKQCSDVFKTYNQIPLYHYNDFDDFYNHLPYSCKLIGVEITDDAQEIKNFQHPNKCVYLLGSEDSGLTKKAISKCHDIIKIPGNKSLNVSVAGSIIMYDRLLKTS